MRTPAKSFEHHVDVVIAGAGPAGRLLASEAAGLGLRVLVADPTYNAPWTNRYAVWVDEWSDQDLGPVLHPVWPRAVVHLGEKGTSVIERAYAFVDAVRLQSLLARRCDARGVRRLLASVDSVRHDSVGAHVSVAGQTFIASVFVDATGHGGAWLQRSRGPRAFQTAYGVLADVVGFDEPRDAAVLMDWREPTTQPLGPGQPPSFLYALPMPGGRWFLEETVLVRDPEVPIARLRMRLEARLAMRGARIEEVHHTERCRIPMDMPIPDLSQPTVAFGASAGLIHPATGYQLAYAARLAPDVARVLRAGIDAGDSPSQLSRAAWRAVWPRAAQRRRRLFDFGADVVSTMDPETTRTFFGAFFGGSPERARGYLSRETGLSGVAASM
ncbi:MAG: lycopene beta-cyclase, partial [Myxococcota bacterium]